MNGDPSENKEVKPYLYFDLSDSAWYYQNVKLYADFITLTLNRWNKKNVMGLTFSRNGIKHGVDIFIYPGVCVLFIYFLKRFSNLNSFFSMIYPVFLKLLFTISLKKMHIIFKMLLRTVMIFVQNYIQKKPTCCWKKLYTKFAPTYKYRPKPLLVIVPLV